MIKKTIVILCMVFLVIPISVFSVTLESEDICYTMDDIDMSGSVVEDYMGNHNGYNQGTASIAGVFNEGRDFEYADKDYINVSWNLAGVDQKFTFSAIVKLESLTTEDIWVMGDEWSGAGNDQCNIYLTATAVPKAYAWDGSSAGYADAGVETVATGEWHLLTYTYDNGDINFYIDGTNIGSGSIPNMNGIHDCMMKLGTFNNGDCSAYVAARTFDGIMDEVVIAVNTVWTDADVLDRYNTGSFKSCEQLTSGSDDILNITSYDGSVTNLNNDLWNNTLHFSGVVNGTYFFDIPLFTWVSSAILNFTADSIYNAYFEVGEIDGIREWNHSGMFNGKNYTNFVIILNDTLKDGCVCTNCSIINNNYCRVPIYFAQFQLLEGSIKFDKLNITYNYYEFDDCTTFNFSILNISYKDELTFQNISAINAYELTFKAGLYTQSLSGVPPISSYNAFCTNANTTNLGLNISMYGILNVQKTDYETRIIENNFGSSYIFSTPPYYDLPIYLISSGNSSQVTFTLKDSLIKTIIPDVQVKLYKLFNGSYSLVEQKLTDATGKVKFSFVENSLYRVYFSKTGYNEVAYNFNPFISTSYDIYLIKTVTETITQNYDRTYITWTPQQWYADENNFSITFYNPYLELNTYSYELLYPGGNTTDGGTISSGETLTALINLTGVPMLQRIKLTWTYDTDLAGTRTQIYYYDIMNATPGNYTMMALKDKTYGLGLFERLFITIIIVLFIVGIATLAGKTEIGIFIGISWFSYSVIIGFIPKWSILISIFATIILITGDK